MSRGQKVISIDISGNWGREGMGTSGLCYLVDGEITKVIELKGSDYPSETAYWMAHWELLEKELPDHIVMEGFKLYGNKSKEQINSELQTPQAIGVIKMFCYQFDIPLTIQFASEVKTRWSDEVLFKKGIINLKGTRYYWRGQVLNSHKKDSIRHAMHFQKYKLNKL